MSITLQLSPELEARLRTEANYEGRSVEDLAIAWLNRYPAPHPEARALLEGPFHPLEEGNARLQAKYGLPDLAHLSRENLAELMEEALTKIEPGKIAEAERLGHI